MLQATVAKQFDWQNILFPNFIKYFYTPKGLRYVRNCNSLRTTILKIINDRRNGKSHTYNDDSDLLSILLSTDFYKDQDDLMVDELITFFLAGMKTIQVSTTNLIYFMTKH